MPSATPRPGDDDGGERGAPAAQQRQGDRPRRRRPRPSDAMSSPNTCTPSCSTSRAKSGTRTPWFMANVLTEKTRPRMSATIGVRVA